MGSVPRSRSRASAAWVSGTSSHSRGEASGGPGLEVGVEPDQQAGRLVAELVADDAGLREGEGLRQPEHVGVEAAGEQHVADREQHVVDTEDLHARHCNVPG